MHKNFKIQFLGSWLYAKSFCSLWIFFFKINFFKTKFHEYHHSVNKVGLRSGPTFCRAWSESQTFCKNYLSRRQKVPLAVKELKKDQQMASWQDYLMKFMQYFSDFLYKSICWYLFKFPRPVKAIQMSTHNICFYKVAKSTQAVFWRQRIAWLCIYGLCVIN